MDVSAQEVPVLVANDDGPAVVICDDSPPEKWLARVARELNPASVVFVWCNEAKWSATKVSKQGRSNPSQTDLELAASFLARERKLNPGDQVVFRCELPKAPIPVDISVEVPRNSAPGTLEQILTAKGMEVWIEQQNAKSIPQIVQSLRSAMGVIPFLGAGTSFDFKYPLWGPFFEQFANAAAENSSADPHKLTDEKRDEVIALAENQQFEKAADILVKWNKDAFYAKVKEDFGWEPDLGNVSTPLTRLPLIASGPIITTNFDPVIETVYKHLGKPFADDRRILGARKYPDLVVTALQQNWSALIKLHGDARNTDSLIFTEIEYEEGYGDINTNPGPVERLATVIYTNRPLLFLGCSLETDRTLTSLENVHKRNHFVGHYAVLAAPFRSRRRDERVKRLGDAGIRPLWYRPGEFKDIEALMDDLVERTALDELALDGTPSLAVPAVSRMADVKPDDARADRWPDLTEDHLKSVAAALVAGRLVFFLGAAVHTNRMHGQEFYSEICRLAQIPWPSRDRTDAAQHVADLDRNQLSAIVSKLIHTHYTQPGRAHQFLASLPARLKPLGQIPLTIVTTNYDAVTEAAFAAASEPYHLFVYNHSGAYAGRFLYRCPDGREYAIRTPAAIRGPLTAPAIIKLNGGIDPLRRWPESFVVASSDFEELSTRLPDVLPQVVWDALRTRSLLFLGHGLREPDVRSIIRRRRREAAPNSWAVLLGKTDSSYWQVAGIELIEADLNVYIDRLDAVLAAHLSSLS